MKFWKSLLTVSSVILASVGTLLFQPTVFCGITIPVTAKILGWKAQAVAARLSAFGTLEIQGLEAVNPGKSRIAMDSARVEFDPVRLVTGRPEILRADFRFSMVDLEFAPAPERKKKAAPISVPFSLREASVDLVEGRLRTETGAWILKSAHVSAEGWDGKTPREIRVQLGRLDWNGPGQQELATTTQATAKKSKDPSGGDLWDLKFTTDVTTVVDLPPWNLISPCQLMLDGKAVQSGEGEWRVDGLKAVWQGVGGVRLAAKLCGTYAASGVWTAKLDLEPTDLQLAGIFLKPRGIENMYGTVAGTVRLQGGPQKSLGVGVELNGQNVQLVAAGASWPSQPSALGISSRGEWRDVEGTLKIESLAANLGTVGQPADFQLTLDRPAAFQLAGQPKAEAGEPASLQWAVRGLEMAAVAPIFVAPEKLKLEGGKMSANGQARIEGEKIGLSGRVESRSMTASGLWVNGKLAMQSATFDFQGYVEKATRMHLESARLAAAWEGGMAEDLLFTAKAEWDTSKNEGFLAGDLNTGLAGLGKAWAAAEFWPQEGQAKAHVEFSGNPAAKGAGLVSVTLGGMKWPGERADAWGAQLASEVSAEKGSWTVPDLVLKADRSGQPLVDGRASVQWTPGRNLGRVRIELARAESALVVPLLKNLTPDWQWSEASGKGSIAFSRREDGHDHVEADLQAAVTVDTGTPTQPRVVDFSSVQGKVRASWPSGVSGILSFEALSLVAKHRDGTEAVRASLDAPLKVEKKGPGEWSPAGSQPCSGLVQFAGWPIGLLAPLVLPEAKENSITGTLSGFLKVQSDPKQGNLGAQLDLSCPDLSLRLPRVQLNENRTSVQAEMDLGKDRNLVIRKVMLASQQAGTNWIEFSAEKAAHPGLAVVGKVDLAVLRQNVPAVSSYVSQGNLLLKANVGEPKSGVRRLGFSTQAQNLGLTLPGIGTAAGLQVEGMGTLDWDQNGPAFLDDLQINADGLGGKLQIGKLDWKRGGTVSWESARAPGVWMAFFTQAWLQPNRWVDGDLLLGPGFWEAGDHGSSGQIDATLLEGKISEKKGSVPLSLRLGGDWEYDTRTHFFILKEASVFFPEFRDEPVQIPSLQTGPGIFQIKAAGGVLDLRGLLDQVEAWRPSPAAPGAPPPPAQRIDISVNLDQVVLPEARVGPVKISRLRYGPEGVLLEPSSVEVQGGVIRGSVVQTGGAERPLQARLFVEKFPLGAILGPMIQDARGPLGGFADLQFNGQAAGAKLEDLQRSLSGQGNFRIYQAHLEYLPAIQSALQAGGLFLGSRLVANSEINDLGGSFSVQGTSIQMNGPKIRGTTLDIDLSGQLDWFSQAINFRGPIRLTREAMNSSSNFQGAMTKLISSSNEYYTQLPGDLMLKGTLSKPEPSFDQMQAGLSGLFNAIGNTVPTILQGAGDAAGGATGAAGQLLQSLPFPFGR